MTSFSVSNKPFITSMLLDEVQVLLFDFATSIQSGHEPFNVGIYSIVYQIIMMYGDILHIYEQFTNQDGSSPLFVR